MPEKFDIIACQRYYLSKLKIISLINEDYSREDDGT